MGATVVSIHELPRRGLLGSSVAGYGHSRKPGYRPAKGYALGPVLVPPRVFAAQRIRLPGLFKPLLGQPLYR